MKLHKDWAKDLIGTDITFIEKIGDHLLCEYEGFLFKPCRSNWPPKRLTPEVCTTPTEYYKYQVRKLHGDLYDLNKTVYNGADNLVTATCKKHGDFQIHAKYFKSRRGCPLCGNESIGLKTRSNTQDFIIKSKLIHGENKYDYSLVEYETTHSLITIICKEHGPFETKPTYHLVGKGCRECGLIKSRNSRVLSQNEVIRRFKEKHDERYDYSQVVYSGDAHGLVTIICKEHGEFLQSYANHYHNGQGCPTCAKDFSPRLKSGFVKSYDIKNYASLYLIRCWDENESFSKIGITTKPIERRFAGPSTLPYSYEVSHLFLSTGNNIWDLETKLHSYYKDMTYLPLKNFGGRYECFYNINLEEYLVVLNQKLNELNQ